MVPLVGKKKKKRSYWLLRSIYSRLLPRCFLTFSCLNRKKFCSLIHWHTLEIFLVKFCCLLARIFFACIVSTTVCWIVWCLINSEFLSVGWKITSWSCCTWCSREKHRLPFPRYWHGFIKMPYFSCHFCETFDFPLWSHNLQACQELHSFILPHC